MELRLISYMHIPNDIKVKKKKNHKKVKGKKKVLHLPAALTVRKYKRSCCESFSSVTEKKNRAVRLKI